MIVWPFTAPIPLLGIADDTTIVGLITDDDEAAYREEVRLLGQWCQNNNLFLNVSKTKMLVPTLGSIIRYTHPFISEGTK